MKFILEFVYKDLDSNFNPIVFNSRYIIEVIKNKFKKEYKNVYKVFVSGKEIRRLKNAVFYVFNKNMRKLFLINWEKKL